jgi:nicotinate-nucleotide pyrophosphorylase (carboxylating)
MKAVAPEIQPLTAENMDVVLRFAIEEDLGSGDVTTEVVIPQERRALGRLYAKQEGVLAGLCVFRRVFELVDEDVRVMPLVKEGARVRPGEALAKVLGRAQSLLAAERTALNFVQRLSGIATLTARFVERVGPNVTVVDTRKTTPGLRQFERFAVRCGGGDNHRFGLFEEVMVKNNHIDLAQTELVEMVMALRAHHGEEMRITVEARNRLEALDGVAGGADCILLDNVPADEMRALVPELRRAAQQGGRPLQIEASGSVTLENVALVAQTGIDRVSIGALTHSAAALDLSFGLEVLP